MDPRPPEPARVADDLAHALVDHELEVVEDAVDVVVHDEPVNEDDQHNRAFQFVGV